jgi:phosphatidylglycerol---prolipoprotein diacylglyceryl transferase
LLFARLFYVAFNWNKFSADPLLIISTIQQGGLAIFGAFIGAFIYIFYYTVRFRFNIYEFLDVIAPGLLLGQIIGRFGNFFNYEAFGKSTSVLWKMYVPDVARLDDLVNKYYHPTFLYEIIPNCILFFILMLSYPSLTRRHAGKVFAFYAIGYGVIRFFTEFFREDALFIKLPFKLSYGIIEIDKILVSQLAAIVLLVIGLITLYNRKRIYFDKKGLEEISIRG